MRRPISSLVTVALVVALSVLLAGIASSRALARPHTGTLRYTEGIRQIPAAAISIEDATLLSRLQATGEAPRVQLSMEAHTEPDAPAANVIGEIPGSQHPEEIVVMGGHIDSWDVGQGAQDDGSGIMATLEAAAIIRQKPLRF